MLANAIITRSTLALMIFFLLTTASNISRVAAQSSLPTMPAADAPIIDYQNRYLPTYGKAGMVVKEMTAMGSVSIWLTVFVWQDVMGCIQAAGGMRYVMWIRGVRAACAVGCGHMVMSPVWSGKSLLAR